MLDLCVLAAVMASVVLNVGGHVNGTPADDRLHGTLDGDVINGYAGDDRSYGRPGSDVLGGGAGDDVLRDWVGGAGHPLDPSRDAYRAGPGDDTLYVGRGDRVRAGWGRDHIWAYHLDGTEHIDCGPGDHDVLHVHQDLNGFTTRGCDRIVLEYAG